MKIELGILHDGRVMLASDTPLPHVVKRVEFYRDQRLFMLVYNTEDEEGELMHYEVPDNMSKPIEKSPNVIIYSLFPDHEPIGYKVPLIKVGELY
jgi:hypothetical protein